LNESYLCGGVMALPTLRGATQRDEMLDRISIGHTIGHTIRDTTTPPHCNCQPRNTSAHAAQTATPTHPRTRTVWRIWFALWKSSRDDLTKVCVEKVAVLSRLGRRPLHLLTLAWQCDTISGKRFGETLERETERERERGRERERERKCAVVVEVWWGMTRVRP
jgi:hypothetical protein